MIRADHAAESGALPGPSGHRHHWPRARHAHLPLRAGRPGRGEDLPLRLKLRDRHRRQVRRNGAPGARPGRVACRPRRHGRVPSLLVHAQLHSHAIAARHVHRRQARHDRCRQGERQRHARAALRIRRRSPTSTSPRPSCPTLRRRHAGHAATTPSTRPATSPIPTARRSQHPCPRARHGRHQRRHAPAPLRRSQADGRAEERSTPWAPDGKPDRAHARAAHPVRHVDHHRQAALSSRCAGCTTCSAQALYNWGWAIIIFTASSPSSCCRSASW